MRRRLFNLAVTLSLLGALAVVAVWCTSRFVSLGAGYSNMGPTHPGDYDAIYLYRGVVEIVHQRIDQRDDEWGFFHFSGPDADYASRLDEPLGAYGFEWRWENQPDTIRRFAVPCWAMLLPTLVLPALWIVAERRWRYIKSQGIVPCRACG